MVQPKGDWIRFKDDSEKLNYMKKCGLVSKTATAPKQLVYSGVFGDGFCTLLGYVDDFAAVVSINDQLHCIMPEHLKEMQQGLVSLHLPEQYVVLDIETTGLSPKTNSIIEIAAVKYQSGIQVDTFESLVFTDDVLPLDIQSLTGISPEELSEAPTLDQVIPGFASFISGLPLVAHNSSFDLGFLRVAFSKCGLSLDNEEIDTLKLARKAFPALTNHTLFALKEYLSIHVDASHRALPDALATGELYIRCTEQLIRYRTNTTSEEAMEGDVSTEKPIKQTQTSKGGDPSHPLYQKKIVFTGELSISRSEAMQQAIDVGAVIRTSVSTKTDFLVVGQQDPELVGSDGKSSKEEKAQELISSGKGKIQILHEAEFMSMLNYKQEEVNDEQPDYSGRV